MHVLKRLVCALPYLIAAPIVVLLAGVALALCDAAFWLAGKRRAPPRL